jgi:hypothetical protein
MDPSAPLGAALTFLLVIALFQLHVWVELKWQSRRRETLNRLLIMALLRMSKKEIAALEEHARRVDGFGAVLLATLRERASDPVLTANVASDEQAEVSVHPAVDPSAPRVETDDPAPGTIR